jgi:hypothetical protein
MWLLLALEALTCGLTGTVVETARQDLRPLSEKHLRTGDGAGHGSDWSADQEAAHARIIAVAAITFDMSAEKSAGEEPTYTADDRARDDTFRGACTGL